MDTFMDKLAQKLNAQEMIRANTAADAEEMSKLKNQIKEYNECLEKLQKLLADGEQKLNGAQVNGEELNRLVQESIAKIQAMQQNTDSIDEMKKALEAQQATLDAKLNDCNENVHKECVKVYRNVQAVVVEENSKQSENIAGSFETLKDKMNVVLGVSVMTMVVSLCNILIEILRLLNVKLF